VSEFAARGYLLDATALAALGSSRRVSVLLLTAAPHFQLQIYAPVTCVDAADRIRPGIARHVGRLDIVEPVDLTYSVVLHLRERTPQESLDIAHVIALARPNPQWFTGLIVATTRPNQYTEHELAIYPVSD
jgi:hypothetical protein